MTIGQRPRRADARRNYERLLQAAGEVFTEHGAEAPMDEVARRAGVGPGTLYRHFPTRHDLLVAVYVDQLEAFVDQVRTVTRDQDPQATVETWVRMLVGYTKQKEGLGSAVKAMLAQDAETFAYCRTLLRGALGEALDAAREAGVIREEARAEDVMRLAHGLGRALESSPQDADRLVGFLLDGLRPQPQR